jgi:hypothetical protein
MQLRFATIIGTCAVLAGCSGVPTSNPDPLSDVERLSDVALADGTSQEDAVAAALAIAATPEEAEGGFLSGLFGASDSGGGVMGMLASGNDANTPVVRTGPDAQLIPYGESVAYGEIATVCDVPRGSLGTEVANISGFKIYDTIPNATALRPHFITGFDDGCARQFSAALSLTGDVGTHEIVRYLPTNRNVAYSSTDNAYEAIKASVCRVSHGTPCGARLDSLANNTTFVTAYEKFGAHPRWVEILLHDGEVSAIDFKQR